MPQSLHHPLVLTDGGPGQNFSSSSDGGPKFCYLNKHCWSRMDKNKLLKMLLNYRLSSLVCSFTAVEVMYYSENSNNTKICPCIVSPSVASVAVHSWKSWTINNLQWQITVLVQEGERQLSPSFLLMPTIVILSKTMEAVVATAQRPFSHRDSALPCGAVLPIYCIFLFTLTQAALS